MSNKVDIKSKKQKKAAKNEPSRFFNPLGSNTLVAAIGVEPMTFRV